MAVIHRALLSLMLGLATAHADEPKPRWFVPPATAGGSSSMDISLGSNGIEAITVVAKRASRSWRSVVIDHQNDPRASDAAHPRENFVAPRSYCNAALRTVGGQPGSAADMITGAGAGGC